MKKYIFLVLYLPLTTCLLLVALELALRIAAPSIPNFVNYEFYTNLHGDLPPNLKITDNLISGLPYRVTTNSQGLRSLYDIKDKTDDIIRVLCLGDSFTYGIGVNDAETYPAILEHLLQQKYPGKKIEVINSGIPFFDIVDELDQWIDKGQHLHPDLVILQFYINDIQTMNGLSFRRTRKSKQGEYNPLINTIKKSKIFSLASVTAYTIHNLLKTTTTSNVPTADTWYSGRYCPEATDEQYRIIQSDTLNQDHISTIQCRWDKYIQNLMELKSKIETSGSKFLFINIPDVDQITKNKVAPSAYINNILHKNNTQFIDFLPIFREMHHRERLKLYNSPYDFHTNMTGNTLLAAKISELVEIEKTGLKLLDSGKQYFDYSRISSHNLLFNNGHLEFESALPATFNYTIFHNDSVHFQGVGSVEDHLDLTSYDESPGVVEIDISLKEPKRYFSLAIHPIIFNDKNSGPIKLHVSFDNGEQFLALDRTNQTSADEPYLFSKYFPERPFKHIRIHCIIGKSTAIVIDKNNQKTTRKFILSLG